MKNILLIPAFLVTCVSFAQVVNTAMIDTVNTTKKGKLVVEVYLDTYYAYNFNKPKGNDQPYLVSMARHNEVNVNLAFIDLKYSSARSRARIVPGFGTYMNTNYAHEQTTLKHFIEASAGYKVSKSKNIWVDAGVLGSPYTNESAISKDHLAYTRSLAAENVPYYLSGVKVSVPLTKKLNSYFYVVNGWQQINDQNANKSVGTQLEWRPNDFLLLNWNTFIGNEQSAVDSIKGLRTFTDVFLIYNRARWSFTSSVYAGRQVALEKDRVWWQANVIARYSFTSALSVTGRVEYFKDQDGVLVVPITSIRGFETAGASLGVNVQLDSNLLLRAEARHFFSQRDVYLQSGLPVNQSTTLTTSVCIWF